MLDVANKEATKGLFIYSTEKNCIEYWDSAEWVDPIMPTQLPWQISPGSPFTRNAATVVDSIFHTGVVSVGTKNTDPTAVLFVQSDSLGVVVPRMTEAQSDKIKKPANGLLVFNTDEQCFNYYSLTDTTWQSLCGKLGKAIIDSAYCSQIRVYGSYIKGVETTVNERLVIPVEVTKIGSYDITVVAMLNTTTDNGYTFTASGTFLYEGKQTITLTAQGTPTSSHFDPNNPAIGDGIQINFNGMQIDPSCSNVAIPVVPAAADYTVSCGSAVVYGVYTMAPDTTNSDNNTHYIEVQVNVNDIASGATSGWSAETNKVSGVQFRGSGTFTGLGVDTVRLYAVAGSRPTTLDPIMLTMTFQTKNGAVDCQVNFRAAYTPKKIVVFGYASTTYGYALNASNSRNFLASQYNFGNLPESTVKMVWDFTPAPGYTKVGAFSYRYVGDTGASTTDANWTQILTEKPDIVILSYNSNAIIATTTIQLIMQYLYAGGILLQYTDESAGNPVPLLNSILSGGASNASAGRGGGSGAYTTLVSVAGDPILTGPFQPAGVKTLAGLDLCGDTEINGLYQVTNLPGTVIVYGYNCNGTGTGPVVFRATGVNYCYFGEAGFFTGIPNPTGGTICPFYVGPGPQYSPAMRPVATPNFPNGAYNSFYFGNQMAWAINQAQFYGINSGN